MPHITADRVRDTSTSTGTGAFTVTGSAPAGYRTFSAVCATSDTFFYAIQHQTSNEWEVGLGTYSASNQITRTTVLSSSNSNAAVNFSAGAKDVYLTFAAGGIGVKRLTETATTSGTSRDFSDIPPWVRRITILFADVSLSGNEDILVQIGTSGGLETTGYASSGTNMFSGGTSTSGFLVRLTNAAFAFSGSVTLHNVSGNLWVASVVGSTNNATYAAVAGGGSKTLSAVLDRVRVLSSGTNTFDAGTVNLIYEG